MERRFCTKTLSVKISSCFMYFVDFVMTVTQWLAKMESRVVKRNNGRKEQWWCFEGKRIEKPCQTFLHTLLLSSFHSHQKWRNGKIFQTGWEETVELVFFCETTKEDEWPYIASLWHLGFTKEWMKGKPL